MLGALVISLGAPTLAGAASTSASRPVAISPIGLEPCPNLPVSSAIVQPSSCVVTGPTSVLVTGSAPGSASKGVAVAVDSQLVRSVSTPTTGRLTFHGIASGHACMTAATGEQMDLDLASMQLQRAAARCPAPDRAPLSRSAHPNASQEVIPAATAVGAPPSPASSYYVYGAFVAQCGPTATSGCPLYVDGADEPAPSGGALAVLDFGAPCFDPLTNVYGAQLFNTRTCTTDDQLLVLAEAFYRGYQSTHGAGTPPAVVALGTSNSLNGVDPGNALTTSQMQASGEAWFQNLVRPFAAATSAAALVVAWGGDDIEQSSDTGNWYGPVDSTAWVDGYGGAASGSLGLKRCAGNDPFRLADYGDNVLGAGGWTDSQIYYVAGGATVACAVPEIYVAANATQWQRTSQWGVSNHRPAIAFTGPMSLNGEAGYLSGQASWNDLAAATGQSPPYLTDIGSLNASPPGPPSNVLALAGDQSATAWWTPPTADNGSPVQDYVVTAYAGNSPGPSTTVSGLPPPTTATVRGLTNGVSYSLVVAATNAAGTGTGSLVSNSFVPGPGRYHPLTPKRILDTRDGTGVPAGALGPASQVTLQVTGTSPLPSGGIGAVVLNVTAADTTAPSYLTVFPAGLPRPTASNLNWTPGMIVPNLVEVPVGPTGGVSFFNAAGSVNVVADVEGYVGLANDAPAPDGLYAPVAPTRVLDTRTGTPTNPIVGALGQGQLIHVTVAHTGQEAVALNVTVTGGTRSSYLTVWPDGETQPPVSNLNFVAGQTVANRVMVKVGSNAKVSIFNAAGSVHVVADLNGSFSDATAGGSGVSFQGIQPARIVDTRNGTGGSSSAIGPGGIRPVGVAGANGIPSGATAVVANLTATNTSAAAYLTAWPDGETQPTASDLNWVIHETVANLVVVKLGANGKVDLFNAGGSTDVVLDVVGYYR